MSTRHWVMVVAAGCGACGGPGPMPLASDGGSFEPLFANASWTYRVMDIGTSTKTETVEMMEAVPKRTGATGWRLRTNTGTEQQLTWQGNMNGVQVRFRDEVYAASGALSSEESYSPSRLRVDETRLTKGDTYTETFTDVLVDKPTNQTTTVMKQHKWQVMDPAEVVTVPAGTFSCLHLRKFNGITNQVNKDYWFARGVGKVKETAAGSGRVEELTEVRFP